jgi:serine/threonine-protein kinase
MRSQLALAATGAFLLELLLASDVRAQTSADSAAAQGLFDEAKALMAAGKPAEACPKLEESQRLDPGSGTLVNLAKCYEQTRRIASAWSKFLEAAVSAKAAGNADRETGAREAAAALAPRVSKLIVLVPSSSRVQGLEVSRDGAVVGPPQWGMAIPADEGEHAIVAKAPGHQDWRGIAVIKGEGTTTSITVPRPVQAEHAPALALGVPSAAGPAGAPRAATDESSGLGTQRVLALVAGGVGIVGLGVGTVFALKTMSKQDEAEKYCDGTACRDPRGVTAGNDANAAGNIATIGMVAGAVGVAGGLTLWFTAPKQRSTEVAVGFGTVRIRGTW